LETFKLAHGRDVFGHARTVMIYRDRKVREITNIYPSTTLIALELFNRNCQADAY